MSGGFKLGGIDASFWGIELLEETEISMLPATRDNSVVIAGVHGAYDFGGLMDVRNFELRCVMKGANSKAELQAKIRDFVSHLVNVRGEPKTLSLVFDTEPDKTYQVRYSGEAPLEDIISLGLFTLPLTAFDPFAYGEVQYVEQIIENSPESIMVSSQGNVATLPVIMMINEGSNTINGFTIKYYEEIIEEG